MFIHVLLNQNQPQAMIKGYCEGDLLVLAAGSFVLPEIMRDGIVTIDPPDYCERVFHLLNAPEEFLAPSEQELVTEYRRAGERSLSIGDVIGVGDDDYEWRFYACERVGFREIPRPSYA